MNTSKEPLFRYLDCIELYTPDIQQGIEYYCNSLGLKVLWKSESSAGLGMSEGKTEIVIQNERKEQNMDIKVDSVLDAVKEIEKAGGRILYGPFDIQIGKCAVVLDPWDIESPPLNRERFEVGGFLLHRGRNLLSPQA